MLKMKPEIAVFHFKQWDIHMEKLKRHIMKCDTDGDHQWTEVSWIEWLVLVDHIDEWIIVNDNLLLTDEIRLMNIMERLIPTE